MEFLDPQEAEKFKKQKREQFGGHPVVMIQFLNQKKEHRNVGFKKKLYPFSFIAPTQLYLIKGD